MNGFEQSWRMGLVTELHTIAGNLQHSNSASQLRTQLQHLQQLEQQLIDLIAELEVPPKYSP